MEDPVAEEPAEEEQEAPVEVEVRRGPILLEAVSRIKDACADLLTAIPHR